MNSEWEFSELGKEAINASRSFSFKDFPKVVFVNTSDVLAGRFLHSNVSEGVGLPGQAKKALKMNDILLTEIRPGNGRYAYVDFDASNFVVSTKFMVIETLGRVSPRFLYHVLTNQSALDEFQRIAESRSGTFPQITFDSIAHFPVPIPPKTEQENLVRFLDALDDRITLLRETNATLEGIAQALFKSWFVDFDPVRAKMEGRAPDGMDEATAALFPDDFEESRLGLIPTGWRICEVSDVAKLFSGGTPDTRKPEYWCGDLRWFSSGETRNLIIVDTEKRINVDAVASSSTRLALPGDILIASAGQGHTRGQTSYCAIDTYINQSVVAIRAKENECGSLWLFNNLIRRYAEMRDLSDSHSSRGSLTTKLLGGMLITLPPKEVWSAFEATASALTNSQIGNNQQAQTLTILRDTLLPRLITGQLRVKQLAH